LDIPSNTSGSAESIFISGNTIYIAGYYINNSGKTPCYWANGSRQDLTMPDIPGVIDAWATGIYVRGGSIYISGNSSDGHKNYPTIWSGTAPLTTAGAMLPNTNGGRAGDIFVTAAGTVFVAGYDFISMSTPCFWQGNTRHLLTVPAGDSNMVATDIYVTEGGTIFTSGYGSFPYYWTGDSTSTKLQQPSNTDGACAISIFVANNTIYTAGSYYDDTKSQFIACYWQGTTMYQLSPDMPGFAGSIFVK
jgi:hypothetical protein